MVEDLSGDELEAYLQAIATDWREAALSPVDHALCVYAEKLTKNPGGMTEGDIEALRAAGLTDEAIHEAIQIISYFNYINRVADASHVDLEPEMQPYPQRG